MKKFWKSLMFALVGVFALSSCEDVPMPYLIPGVGNAEAIETEGDGSFIHPYTVADALALLASGKTFTEDEMVYVKGIVSKIETEGDNAFNPQYGNMTYWISPDGTTGTQLEVYRGKGLDGEKFQSADDLKVGDDVIVYGQLVNFKGTYEFTQGSKLVKLNDQIIVPVEMGESKGSGTWEDPYNVPAALRVCADLEKSSVSASYPTGEVYVKGIVSRVDQDTEENFSMYHNLTYYISEDGNTANQLEVYRGKGLDGADFVTQEDLKVGDEVVVCGQLINFNGTYEITQGSKLVELNGQKVTPPDYSSATGDGTLQNPYNPVAALQVCSQLEKTTSNNDRKLSPEVYIKGVVTSVVSEGNNAFNPQFGNLTYYISETGNEEEQQLEVYRGMGLGNTPFASQDALKPGDRVVICGQLINYNGTFEVNQGNYLVELNGQQPEVPDYGQPSGTGVQNDPYNVAGALTVCSTLEKTTDSKNPIGPTDVYTRGIITKIQSVDTGQYGNATYFISDLDATGAPINELEIYRGYYLNGDKFTSADQIKVGDEVVVCGQLVNFKGTFEYTQGSKIVSITGGELPDNPDPQPTGDENITVQGNVVTITNPTVGPTPGDAGTTYDLNELLTAMQYANAQEVTTIRTNDGVVFTFDKGTGSTTPKYYTGTKGVRMYANNTLNIQNTNQQTIAKVELTCDAQGSTYYVGNDTRTAEFGNNGITIANINSEASGGVQLRIQTITIFFAQ